MTRLRGIVGTLRGGHAVARGHWPSPTAAPSYARSSWHRRCNSTCCRSSRTPTVSRRSFVHRHASRTDRLAAWLQVGAELHELARARRPVLRPGRAARERWPTAIPCSPPTTGRCSTTRVVPTRDLGVLLRQGPGTVETISSVHASCHRGGLARRRAVRDPLPRSDRRPSDRHAARSTSAAAPACTCRGCWRPIRNFASTPSISRRKWSTMARARLEGSRSITRAELHVGDVRDFAASCRRGVYGLVTLLNSVYYFAARNESISSGDCARSSAIGGELVVVTMATPGSVASAHLQFMLVCQSGAASLPEPGEIEADLERAGLPSRRDILPGADRAVHRGPRPLSTLSRARESLRLTAILQPASGDPDVRCVHFVRA